MGIGLARWRRSLALALAFAAAGCVGGGAPEGHPSSTVSSGDPAADATETPAASSPDPDVDAPAPAPAPVPVAWDGRVPAGGCVPSGPGSCASFALGSSDTVRGFELDAAPTAANLTLSWTASSELVEALTFALQARRDCDDAPCSRVLAEAVGPSPLHLEVTGIALEAGELLFADVAVPPRTPSPVVVALHTEQAFHVEGMVTVTPSSPPG